SRAALRALGHDADVSAGGKLEFEAIEWADDQADIRSRARVALGQRWAIVEYEAGAAREEWCTDGHRGYVLRGESEYEFDDGAPTERMRLGTGALLVPLYAPFKLAEDVAVLDNLSGGRAVLGVAPGYVSEEFLAHDVPRDERVERMEEALDLLQAAWTRERCS